MPVKNKTEKKSQSKDGEEKKEGKKKTSPKSPVGLKRGPGRPRKNSSSKTVSPKKKTKKTKKSESKSIKPQKKAKSIIVDVIQDDDEIDFFRSSAEDILKKEENISPEVLANRAQDLEIDGESIESMNFEKSEFHISESEIDNQKKYFRELSLEIEQKNNLRDRDVKEEDLDDLLVEEFEEGKKKDKNLKNKCSDRRLGLYTRYVWRFLAVVIGLLCLVFFVSFSSLIIDITPKTEILNESALIKLMTSDSEKQASFIDPREEINGTIEDIELNFEKEFSASGEEFVGEEIVGRVKIINDYSRNQALVANTRLHSPEGKEFKIVEAVNIPAGEYVWVDIYAEKPSRDLAISASSFTIPGLWAGLQESIYAESEESFSFVQKKNKYIRTSDISKAKNESENEYSSKLDEEILKRKTSLEKESGEEMISVYLNDYIKTSTEAKEDDELETFLMNIEGSAKVAFFNKDDLKKIALGKLNLLIPDGKELINFNEEDINLIFQNYDTDTKIAQIKANFLGEMILKNNENPINKEALVDLKEDQIKAYLSQIEEIKDFDLTFKPVFIKKAPRLIDKIKVNVIKE